MGDQEWRRARREFLRTHHPDRGGDPAVFVAGLAGFDAGRHPDGRGRAHVVVVRRPRGALGWCRYLVGAARRRARRSPPRVR